VTLPTPSTPDTLRALLSSGYVYVRSLTRRITLATARGAVAISFTPQEHRQEHCGQEGERQHAHQEKKRQQGFAPKMWIDPGFHGYLNSASNDAVERRGIVPTTTEADLSKSSTSSLARRGLTLRDPANDCNPGAISAWRIAAIGRPRPFAAAQISTFPQIFPLDPHPTHPIIKLNTKRVGQGAEK
jgi:hypothetical protein